MTPEQILEFLERNGYFVTNQFYRRVSSDRLLEQLTAAMPQGGST